MKIKLNHGLVCGQRSPLVAAFTLLELMLVVAIIALIAVAALPQVSEYQKRAKSARSSSMMKSMQTAVDQFTLDKGGPPDGATLDVPATAAQSAWIPLDKTVTGFYGSLAHYVTIVFGMYDSPNLNNFDSTLIAGSGKSYSYMVLASSTTEANPNLIGLVGCAFNGGTLAEPNDATLSTCAVNGYEDIGRLLPGAFAPETPANWICPGTASFASYTAINK